MSNKIIWMPKHEFKKYENLLKKGNTFIYYDIETTGINKKNDRIVQLSAVKFKLENNAYVKSGELNIYIKPPFPMCPEVINVHHITNEFLEDKKTEDEEFERIYDFFKDATVIMGYNILKFDNIFMANLYERNGKTFLREGIETVDVFILAKEIISKKENVLENLKLETVANLYGIKNISYHSALQDVYATSILSAKLFNEYINEEKEDLRIKSIPVIKSISPYNKSKKVNYIYMEVSCYSSVMGEQFLGKIYYDVWDGCFVDIDNAVFKYVDLYELENQAELKAKSDGFSALRNYKLKKNLKKGA